MNRNNSRLIISFEAGLTKSLEPFVAAFVPDDGSNSERLNSHDAVNLFFVLFHFNSNYNNVL